MKIDELETNICFDYGQKVVRVYTTKDSVKDGFVKRLQGCPDLAVSGHPGHWSLEFPIKYCRQPYLVVKVTRNVGLSDTEIESGDEGIDLDEAIAS